MAGEVADSPPVTSAPPARQDVGFDLDARTELEHFLDFHRATVHHKLAGLADDDAWRRFVPSLTTAAGVVKHLTCVEQYWFRTVLAGTSGPPLPWTHDPDADMARGDGETVESLLAGYAAECDRSREVAAGLALTDRSVLARHGEHPTLRWVLMHMVEETSRHNGHLDIVRELTDGAVGE